MKRILTSLALAAFAFYTVFFAPPLLFTLIVAMMASLCYYEYAGIAVASGVQGPLWIGYIGGLISLLWPEFLPLCAIAIMTTALTSREMSKAMAFAAVTVLGIVYVFIGWRWAIPLREWSSHWILFALALNWVGDIAAFYVGRATGRHKLAPRVSPGKSWEGAVASSVASVLFGLWYGWQFPLQLGLAQLALVSLVGNAAGQIGDLAESAFKRGAGVKDSSNLLPGHGGFLDRLDSTLFTLPVVYFVVRLISR